MRESYTYQTARQPSPGMFARVLTYHERAVGTVAHEPKPKPSKRRRIAPDFNVDCVVDGDDVVIGGTHRTKRKIGAREIIAAERFCADTESQRVVVLCNNCGREDSLTLGAWRFCEQHGTRMCKACARMVATRTFNPRAA